MARRLVPVAAAARSDFRHLVVCTLVLSLMTMSDAFVYLVLQRQLNFAAGSFPLLYVLTSLGFLLLAIPAGRIADRVGRFHVFVAGYAVLILMYALLDLGAAESWACSWSSFCC